MDFIKKRNKWLDQFTLKERKKRQFKIGDWEFDRCFVKNEKTGWEGIMSLDDFIIETSGSDIIN